jgi:protein phosphatase
MNKNDSSFIIQSFSLSDLGRRKNNEDFAAFFEPSDQAELQKSGCLYIVADGVGGAAKGERASQFAAQKLLYEYYQPENTDLEPLERLRLIMENANAEIYSHASENHTRMATTMVVAVVRDNFLFVANVGDSRAYLIRDGMARQINRDHSIVGEMVEHGEMTEEEAMASKIKNRLTRSLGGDPEVTVDVYPPIPLKVGDKVLLCSDGLTRYATIQDVVRMTAQGKPEEIAKRLVYFANQKGGADNISVITLSCQLAGSLEPTLVSFRPSQVNLETLVIQPETMMVSSNRRLSKPSLSFRWLLNIFKKSPKHEKLFGPKKSDGNYWISIAYPKLLSKKFESSFVFQVFLPAYYNQVKRNVRFEFGEEKTNQYLRSSSIKLGQTIKVKFFSPTFNFPEPTVKLVEEDVNEFVVTGMPKNNCEPGLHKILITITDSVSNIEIKSLIVKVRVTDFAFDHVSLPLLSKVSAFVLGIGSFAIFMLTFLEQIDKTIGLTSGAAAGTLALGIYASFYNLYQRVRPNTP